MSWPRCSRTARSARRRSDAELAARLVDRYGSPAIAGRVRKVYAAQREKLSCGAQAALLAFLWRDDPRDARERLNQTLDAPQPAGCAAQVLGAIARVQMSAELEQIAIGRLNDPHREIAASAAEMLGVHGSAAAEQALWDALEKWHATSKERAGERGPAEQGGIDDVQLRYESSLVQALAQGRHWIADSRKLARLRELCLSENCRDQVDYWLEAWHEPVALILSPGTDSELPVTASPGSGMMSGGSPVDDSWSVAQYFAHSLADVKSLLLRFPAGTTFSFRMAGAFTDAEAENRLISELQERLAPSGSKLVKQPGSR